MAKPKRTQRTPQPREIPASRQAAVSESLHDPLTHWLDTAALALFAARWFTPAEGVFRGHTLWIAQLWLFWGVVASWFAYRLDKAWRPRLNLFNISAAMLIGGHILSALIVFLTTGDKRGALNGLWEWMSLAVTVIWLRSQAARPGFHRQIAIALVASATALSAYGLWQRTLIHPGIAKSIEELDRLEHELPSLAAEAHRDALRRLDMLRNEIGPEYLMLDANGRQAMRQRLIGSSEPLGLFALANTFAALLVGALFVGVELLIVPRRRDFRLAIRAGCLLLVAFVLLLTKSRTAWVGAMAGAVFAGLYLLSQGSGTSRKLFRAGVGLMAVTIALAIGAVALGGLDWAVIAESTKSLRYRGEYWRSTWQVILEHPILGVGSGNFRQHYLAFKLPQSSEEILDPHNLFLDAWANGGLLAFLGLLGLVIVAAGGLLLRRRTTNLEAHAQVQVFGSVPIALLGGALLVAVNSWLFRGSFEAQAALTGLLAAVLAIILRYADPEERSIQQMAAGAAWVAISVHLLGAGGIGMPAVSQLWLWLAATLIPQSTTAVLFVRRQAVARGLPAATAVLLLALAVTQFMSSTLPVAQTQVFMDAAQSVFVTRGSFSRAQQDLLTAANADPLDPEPHRRLAQVAMVEWENGNHPEAFDEAVTWQQQAIDLDPNHAHDLRAMGEMYLMKFQKDRREKDADTAEVWLRSAVTRYPHHSQTQAAFARAAHASGHIKEAATAAAYALRLDQQNRDLGHYDRLLSDDLIRELTKISR